MKLACPRLFEAEALRDGRLNGAELQSYQRHIGQCSACAREMSALDAIARSLRQQVGTATHRDELHARRERTRLLAAFDASLAPPEPRFKPRRWLLAVGAGMALSCGVFAYFHAHPAPSPLSAVAIRADSTAVWSKSSEGQLEKIVLRRGALSVHVEHASGQRRLLVVLPDGELEDIGTTFVVSAEAGRTTRVSVESGSVVLRIHGQPPLAIGAGESWSPSVQLAASPAPTTAPSAPEGSAGTAVRRVPTKPWNGPAVTSPTRAAVPPTPSAVASASTAALEFREAMAALESGDNSRAATRFGAFLSAHPGDRRSEDAAYLRVIALRRAGDPSGTKQAALEYLRRFPSGFRRTEIDALAR